MLTTNFSLNRACTLQEVEGMCEQVEEVYPSIKRCLINHLTNPDFNDEPFNTELAIREEIEKIQGRIIFVYIETDEPGFLAGVLETNRQAIYQIFENLDKMVYLATN